MKIIRENNIVSLSEHIIEELRAHETPGAKIEITGYFISKSTPVSDKEVFESHSIYEASEWSRPGYYSGYAWKCISGTGEGSAKSSTALGPDIARLYSSKEKAEEALQNNQYSPDGASYTFL